MALLRRRSNPEGRMSLGDHLRELRNRLIVAIIAIVLGGVVGWLAYDWLLATLLRAAAGAEPAARRRSGAARTSRGVTTAFSLKLKVALFVGVLIASPVWLYEVWAFIVPGLTRREKRTAMAFVAAAVPLFLAGCYLATWALPKAVEVLLGFTPHGAANLQNASDYLDFVTRFILAFGLAFLLPVFLVMLNVAHVLPARVDDQGLAGRGHAHLRLLGDDDAHPRRVDHAGPGLPHDRALLRRGGRVGADRPAPPPQ